LGQPSFLVLKNYKMKFVQAKKIENKKWEYLTDNFSLNNPLVLVFASRDLLENKSVIEDIRNEFPYEHLVFGSTSGEIVGESVYDNSIIITAIEFEKSTFEIKTASIFDFEKNARLLGDSLIKELSPQNLKHVFVLSEGSFVNGSALIDGIESNLKNNISIVFFIVILNSFGQQKPVLKFQKDSVLIGQPTPVSFSYIYDSKKNVIFTDSTVP